MITLTKLVKLTRTVLFSMGLLTAVVNSANAGTITSNVYYPEPSGTTRILSTTSLSSGDGYNGKALTTPLTWTTTAGLTDTIPVGFWNVSLWTNNPGGTSVVRVDILQGGVSIGNVSYDVTKSGPGNHTTNFAIPVTSAIAFNNQTLGLEVTQVSGSTAQVAADGDFPGSLSWSITSGGTGGGDSGDGTAGPSTDGGSGAVPTTTTFSFNNTSAYPNSQVYVMIIGLDPSNTAGGMSWYNAATGKFQVMQLSDNSGIGSTPAYTPPAAWGLKSTTTYAPYSFTLDQHPSIPLPWITSARIFYSYGYPTYMNVVSTPNGVYAAEPGNPTPSDPNWFMPWDSIEVDFGAGGLNIDTTRVDSFNIPSNFVITSSTGATAQRGDLAGLSHDQYVTAFQSYVSSVGGATVFGPCVLGNPGAKIVNSGVTSITAKGVGSTYFDNYINSVWAQYPAGGTAYFNLPIQGGPYAGQVNASGQMVFTKKGDTTDLFYINRKPTTPEIISCVGVFNDLTNSTSSTAAQQLAIQAATAAAFNRSIATDPMLAVDWTHPGAFYQSAPTNYYAAFWHIHGYAGLAYGFPYDDEASQSSDCNYTKPTNVTLNMWYNPVPPVITSSLTDSGTTGTSLNYQITGSNNPTSFSATGLPAGLSINTTTGVISGTPLTAGTVDITISAINGGGSNSATLVLNIAQAPPVISSALAASGTAGSSFNYQITATYNPTSFNATGLPAGLSVNTATGAITGTPTAAGSSNVTISATNSGGTTSVTLVLTIAQPAPAITSVLTSTGTVGAAFTYQITASNTPTSYNATGLPAGLSVNTGTGAITGTPTAPGSSNVSISASNSGGTGSATMVLTVNALPIITSSLSSTGTVSIPYTYQITATNSPTSYGASNLPVGFTVNASTGVISGTPSSAGTTNVTLTATNASGTSSATLALAISSNTDTNLALNQPATASSFEAGNLVAYANDGNSATRWAASTATVPQWWEVDLGSNQTLSSVYINWYSNTTRYSQYTIQTSTDNVNWATPVNKSTNTTDGPTTDSFSATARYVRVNVSFTSSGYVSAYEIQVFGHSAVPAITSSLTSSATVGTAFNYQIIATNTPGSYAATNLPSGLVVNASTGLISGTPVGIGTSNVVISATNASGTTSATLVLTISANTDTNVALNQTATASSFEAGNLVAYANDGNTSTRWAASDPTVPQWWEVDLGSAKTLSSVNINWYSNATRYSQYTIQTSSDNVNWTTAVNKSTNTTEGPTADTFTATARYVRVNVSFTSSGYVSAYEIQVMGH